MGTLDGQTQNPLADGVHPIEHRFHAKLFGIDAAFLVNHGIPQEPRGNDLILGRLGQEIAGNLLDDELVVRQITVEGVE